MSVAGLAAPRSRPRRVALFAFAALAFTLAAPASRAETITKTVGVAVPDDNATGVASSVSVTLPIVLTSVDVSVNVVHPYRGDLVVTLRAPSGTTLTLHNRRGLDADDLVTTFDAGTMPDDSLRALVGQQGQGTWLLTVSDRDGGDTGTFQSWSLVLEGDRGAGRAAATGTVRYEDRVLTSTGFGSTRLLPVRYADVDVVRAADGAVLGKGRTDGAGAYSVQFPRQTAADAYVRVWARAGDDWRRVQVLNNASQLAGHAVVSATASRDLQNGFACPLDAPWTLGTGPAGAFNILDQGVLALDYAHQYTAVAAPLLSFLWEHGSTDGTYYASREETIRLLGGDADTDEFDDPVILHELGHYVMHAWSRDESPGGDHAWSDASQDPRLAWSEGWSNYFNVVVRDDPVYLDSTAGGVNSLDIETPSYAATAQGQDAEVAVGAALWDLVDRAATPDASPGVDDDVLDYAAGGGDVWRVVDLNFPTGFPADVPILEGFFNGWVARHGVGYYVTEVRQVLAARNIVFDRDHLWSYDTSRAIPDLGQVTADLAVTGGLTLSQVNVFVALQHTYPGDLVVSLRHPDGTTARLFNRSTPLASNGLYGWYQPFELTPVDALTVFSGKPAAGTWQLVVADNASGDTGTLKGWKLHLKGTPSLPDLVVESVTAPTVAVRGQTFQASARTRNLGATAVSAAFSQSFYLSTDRTLSTADVLLGTFSIAGISAGAALDHTRTLTVSTSVAAGTYHVLCVADWNGSTGTVAEDLEGNNAGAAGTALAVGDPAAGVDLFASSVQAPASATVGRTMAVDVITQNGGGTDSGAFVNRYYFSTDSFINAGEDVLVGETAQAALGFAQSRSTRAILTVPAGLAAGSYYLGVLVDAAGQVVETDESNNVGLDADVVVGAPVAGVDLVADSLTAPSSVVRGQAFAVQGTFRNAGASPAPSLVEAYYLSLDTAITGAGDDVLLGSWPQGAVASETQVVSARTLTVPSGTATGSYYLGLLLTAPGDVDAANDWARVSLGVGAPDVADLVPTNVLPPATMIPGSAATVTYSLANQGSANALACSVDLYLSADASISTTADTLLVRVANPAVPGGSGGTYTNTFTLSSLTPPGRYYLGVNVDASGLVAESNELNNTLASAATVVVTLGLLPDLAPANVSLPSDASAGSGMNVSWRLRNLGHGPTTANFVERFYLSVDATASPTSDRLLGQVTETGFLLPGADVVRSTILTIPTSVASAQYFLWVTADAANVLLEENELNNVAVSSGQVAIDVTVPGVDLIPGDLTPPSTATVGSQAFFTASVRNGGRTDATGLFRTDFYLSSDTVITTADAFLGSTTLIGLRALGTSTFSFVATVPSGLTTGIYYLGALVDAGNAVNEGSYEGNNAGSSIQTVTLVATPLAADLLPLIVDGPQQSQPGGAFPVYTVFANRGGTAAAGPFDLRFVLSVDATVTASDVTLGTFSYGGSVAGLTSVTGTYACTVPLGTAPGVYNLAVVVDSASAVAEADETNNVLLDTLPLTLTAASVPPDLVVTAVAVPLIARVGGLTSVAATVRNIGGQHVKVPFELRYYLSSDQVLDAGDQLVTGFTLPGLDSGAQTVRADSVRIPAVVAPGLYWVLAFVDAGLVVAEGVELNNVAVSLTQLQVLGAPDLVVDTVSATTPVLVGQPITFTRTVRNLGSAACTQPIHVRYYLSDDEVITTGQGGDIIILTEAYPGGLASGASHTGTTQVVLPDSTSAWGYFVGAMVDPLDVVAEEDELNNLTVAPLATVAVEGAPDLQALAVSATSTGVQLTPLTVTLSVQNYQNTTAPAFTANVRLSTDRVYDLGDADAGVISFPGLAPGRTVTRTGVLSVPPGVSGNRYTVAWVDPPGNGSIYETVEGAASNSCATPTSSAYRAPDTTPPTVLDVTYWRGGKEILDTGAVGAGPVLVVALFSEPMRAAPQLRVDQAGTNDIGPTSMNPVSGNPAAWTLSFTVPVHDGVVNVDGSYDVSFVNAVDLEGNALPGGIWDSLGVDTLPPEIEVGTPEPQTPVSTVPSVTYTLAGTMFDDSTIVAATVSVNYSVPVTLPLVADAFSTTLTFRGVPPTTRTPDVVTIQARDAAGNQALHSFQVVLDTDGDGIPDWYELLYPTALDRLDPTDGVEDPDGDGLDNYEEYVAGLDPTVADNILPVALAGVDQAFGPARVVQLDGSASHTTPPGGALTYEWTYLGGPVPVTLSPGTNVAQPTFVARIAGTYSFSLRVYDAATARWSLEADVDADVENGPPVAHAGFDRVAQAGAPMVLDGARSWDPDGPPLLTYAWAEDPGNPASVGPLPGVSQPVVVPSVEGTYVFTLDVLDFQGLPAPWTASVTVVVVGPAGIPPTADAGPSRSVFSSAACVLDGQGSVDPDNPPIQDYWWDQASGPAPLAFGFQDQPVGSAAGVVRGTYDVSLSAGDSTALTGPPSLTRLYVHALANRLPNADAGADQLSATTGALVALDGTGSRDPESAPLLYQWEQVGGPEAVLFGFGTPQPTFGPVAPGDYRFLLSVSDDPGPVGPGTVWYTSDEVLVRVLAAGNAPPAAVARVHPAWDPDGDGRVAWGGGPVMLDGSASADADGPAPLALRWVQRAGPWVLLSDDTVAQPSFTPLVPGRYAFDLVAWDGGAETRAHLEVALDAAAGNHVPQALARVAASSDPNGDNAVTGWVVGGPVVLDGTLSSDADGPPLSWQWEQTSGPWAVLSDPTVAQPTFVPPLVGTYGFRLRVLDPAGASSAPADLLVVVTTSGTGYTGAGGGGGGGGCAAAPAASASWPGALLSLLPLLLLLARSARRRLDRRPSRAL